MIDSKLFNAEQVNRSISRFMDYSSDVLNSDMNTFQDRIDVLMSFCESDQVFSAVHKQLIDDDASKFETWMIERKATVRGMVGSGELKFPKKQIDRIRTFYWLLREVYAERLDAVDFSHNFYATGSNSINDRISFFTDTILNPLERELAYRFDDLVQQKLSNPGDKISLSQIDFFPEIESTHEKAPISATSVELAIGGISSGTTNFNSSLRFNAESLIASASEYRELVRGHNRLAAEFPAEKEKLLEFLDYVEKSAKELDQIVPEDDSAGLPSDNSEVRSWMDRFWDRSRSEFVELFSPENMSGLVVPSSLILGLGAIGGIIGGPAGFGVGSLAGQFLSGHVKVGKLSEEIGKEYQE